MINDKYIRFGLCVGLLLCAHCPPAGAIQCAEPHYKSKKCRIAHSYKISDAIFMGQLLSVDEREAEAGLTVYTSEFFVKESYLGMLSGQIKVLSEGGQTPPTNIAGHYLVFVVKAGTGKYFFNPCSDFKFVKIESPLVDTPMQSELRRIATTPGWTFKDENCVADRTVIIRSQPRPRTRTHAVHDSRN